ncbi:putative lipid II flippase FtsW [Candidatus Gracilibacteria bacterium]|nr:putative lipid II flippase FtsW [Candidatus Gracilibacteria bacterium]
MQKKSIDTTLVFLILGLVIFGMIMISSVSVYSSFKVTSRMVAAGTLGETQNYFYLLRNIFNVLMGVTIMVICSKIPFQFFEKFARHIFVVSWIFLAMVFVIGTEYNGAKGWIDLPGLPSIQPVEFMKIALLIMLAYFLKKRRAVIADTYMGFIPYFFYVGIVFLLLIFQPDFGSILILAPVTIALYFVGGGNLKYIITAIVIALIGASAVYGIGKVAPSTGVGYISQRIDNFFRDSHDIVETNNRDDKDYQMKQGLIAIGSGGFFGLGFGKSIQKFGYLPEVQGDFIFSVIVEELGFFGGMVLVFMYMMIAYRGFLIARSVKDPFAKYLALGITTWIMVQASINIGVNLNIVPLTGVTLPFVSYGGSSLLSLMIGVGILLSISRHMEYKPQNLSDILHAKRKVIY